MASVSAVDVLGDEPPVHVVAVEVNDPGTAPATTSRRRRSTGATSLEPDTRDGERRPDRDVAAVGAVVARELLLKNCNTAPVTTGRWNPMLRRRPAAPNC
jgi:hypothetical protein